VPGEAPSVLGKEAKGEIVERLVGSANALDVSCRNTQTVSLQGGESRNRDASGARSSGSPKAVGQAESIGGKTPEVDVAAEIQFEDLLLFRAQLNDVDVLAHFEGVAAARQCGVVGKLIAALDAVHGGVGFAAEIGIAGNIYP